MEYPQNPADCHWHKADTMLWSCIRMLAMLSVYSCKGWVFSDAAKVLKPLRNWDPFKNSSYTDPMTVAPYIVTSVTLIHIFNNRIKCKGQL